MAYSFGYWGKAAVSSSIAATAPASVAPQKPRKKVIKRPVAPPVQKDIFWPQLRRIFTLDHYTYKTPVREQITWFQNHPQWLTKTLTQAAPYMYYVYTQVKKRHLPGELVLLPVIESAYDPFAYSPVGAAGLWQLMPQTASGYGVKEDWWYDGRRDIYASTNAALNYLTYLMNFFNGNWLYAVGSYNAGQGTVQNAINDNAEHDRDTDFWNLPVPNVTNAYVAQLLALAAIIANPHEYGINLPPLKDGPYFAEVNVGTQINLAAAARMAHISLAELYKLNPGYNRWATDPNGPSLLLLPIDKIDIFKQNFRRQPVQQIISWNRYQVRPGDSLSSIANQFGTRIGRLQEINKLNSKMLRIGQTILIPKHNAEIGSVAPQVKVNTSHPKGQIMVDVNIGDSLWSLAIKYQVQPAQIMKWNHLSPNAPLHVGQKLVIFIPQPHQQPNKSQPVRPLNVNYKVVAGDTLDGIARKFGTTAEAIAQLNHLGNRMIQLGENLKIPARNQAITIQTNKQAASVSPSPIQYIATYKVNAGDTLSGIATKFDTNVDAIVKLNQLHGSMIHLDEILKIPSPSTTTNIQIKQPTARPQPQKAQQKSAQGPAMIRYKVKPGDTLSSIARAYHVSVQDLQRWNRAYLGQFLKLGQVLVIYK